MNLCKRCGKPTKNVICKPCRTSLACITEGCNGQKIERRSICALCYSEERARVRLLKRNNCSECGKLTILSTCRVCTSKLYKARIKRCKVCKKEKTFAEFGALRTSEDKRANTCKACGRAKYSEAPRRRRGSDKHTHPPIETLGPLCQEMLSKPLIKRSMETPTLR